jgi:hypothetical protein
MFDGGGVSARRVYLAETLSYNWNLGLIQRRKQGFLDKKFLIQRDRGKNRIKNYRDDHHEFRDFWWKFHDFWISRAIKINSEKIKGINQGLRFNQGNSGCNLGTTVVLGTNWVWEALRIKNEWRERVCHVAAPEWTRSASHCHVSQPYWSMSAQVGPTLVWISDKWAPHMPRGIHLQVHIRPPHPTLCHMAQLHQATSPNLCHMAQLHQATSTQLCHMATLYSTTSAAVNKLLGIKERWLS